MHIYPKFNIKQFIKMCIKLKSYLTMTAAISTIVIVVKSKLSVTITASTASSDDDTPEKLKVA